MCPVPRSECAHRENSDGVALQLGHEVVTGADAESHDGERGILAGIGGEAGGVHDEKILDVVGLLELIEDGISLVGAHAGDAGFVERPAWSGRMGVGANIFCAGGFQHFSGGVAHVLDHGAFVFAVGHVDFEDRNAVNIFDAGVELDEIVPARENLAEAGDADAGAGLEKSLFVGFAEAGRLPVEFRRRLALVAKAAEEFLVGRSVLQVAETRDIDAEWLNGPAERRFCAEYWKFAAAAAAADVRSEVMAKHAAGIGEAIRILGRGGIEQDADRFLRLGAENDGARVDFARLAGVAVDVENAAGAVAVRLHEDSVDHGIRNKRAVSGVEGVGDGGEGGIEIGVRHASALAGSAEMAWATAVDGLGEIGGARGHDGATELFLDAIAEESFLAGERNGRLELAVGEMLEAFGAAGDANVFLDEIVIRFDVFVAKRPVFAVTIERGGFEIPIAEAQADAAPDVGASTRHAQAAHPVKRPVGRRCIRLFQIVDEPVVRIFVANPEFDLDGPCLADDFRRAVAVLELERGLVFGEILVGLRAAGFQQRDLQAGFCEALARPPSGSAGADDDDIIRMVLLLRHKMKIRSEC